MKYKGEDGKLEDEVEDEEIEGRLSAADAWAFPIVSSMLVMGISGSVDMNYALEMGR